MNGIKEKMKADEAYYSSLVLDATNGFCRKTIFKLYQHLYMEHRMSAKSMVYYLQILLRQRKVFQVQSLSELCYTSQPNQNSYSKPFVMKPSSVLSRVVARLLTNDLFFSNGVPVQVLSEECINSSNISSKSEFLRALADDLDQEVLIELENDNIFIGPLPSDPVCYNRQSDDVENIEKDLKFLMRVNRSCKGSKKSDAESVIACCSYSSGKRKQSAVEDAEINRKQPKMQCMVCQRDDVNERVINCCLCSSGAHPACIGEYLKDGDDSYWCCMLCINSRISDDAAPLATESSRPATPESRSQDTTSNDDNRNAECAGLPSEPTPSIQVVFDEPEHLKKILIKRKPGRPKRQHGVSKTPNEILRRLRRRGSKSSDDLANPLSAEYAGLPSEHTPSIQVVLDEPEHLKKILIKRKPGRPKSSVSKTPNEILRKPRRRGSKSSDDLTNPLSEKIFIKRKPGRPKRSVSKTPNEILGEPRRRGSKSSDDLTNSLSDIVIKRKPGRPKRVRETTDETSKMLASAQPLDAGVKKKTRAKRRRKSKHDIFIKYFSQFNETETCKILEPEVQIDVSEDTSEPQVRLDEPEETLFVPGLQFQHNEPEKTSDEPEHIIAYFPGDMLNIKNEPESPTSDVTGDVPCHELKSEPPEESTSIKTEPESNDDYQAPLPLYYSESLGFNNEYVVADSEGTQSEILNEIPISLETTPGPDDVPKTSFCTEVRSEDTEIESSQSEDINSMSRRIPDVSGWTTSDVFYYFLRYFPGHIAQVFVKEEIDGHALLLLTSEDVLENLNFNDYITSLLVFYHIRKFQISHEDRKKAFKN